MKGCTCRASQGGCFAEPNEGMQMHSPRRSCFTESIEWLRLQSPRRGCSTEPSNKVVNAEPPKGLLCKPGEWMHTQIPRRHFARPVERTGQTIKCTFPEGTSHDPSRDHIKNQKYTSPKVLTQKCTFPEGTSHDQLKDQVQLSSALSPKVIRTTSRKIRSKTEMHFP